MENASDNVLSALKAVAEELKYDNCQITLKQLFSGGANYSSYLYNATLSAPGKKDLKLFVKLSIMPVKMKDVVPEGILKIEPLFYTKLLKLYRKLEQKYKFLDNHKLCTPKFYGNATSGLNEILVFEDMTKEGFSSFDRFERLTWEQAAESVGQLAKLHALSFALSKQNPNMFEELKKEFVCDLGHIWKETFTKLSESVIKATEDKDKERILNFINNTVDNEKFNYLFKPITKEVLIHGDFRPNNLMYKVDNGVCKIVSLDFQIVRCGSPVFDLMYFINFAADDVYRQKYFQKTLDHYYAELCESLQRLKIDPDEVYSKEDFDYELKEILPYTTLWGLGSLLIVTVDEEAAPTVLEDMTPDDFVFTPNERFKSRLNEYIQFYTNMGIIPI